MSYEAWVSGIAGAIEEIKKEKMVTVRVFNQTTITYDGKQITIPANTDCTVPAELVDVLKKADRDATFIKERPQQKAHPLDVYGNYQTYQPKPPAPHAHLADPTSPEFNPLEYKRLTGSLPKVAQEAARKLKLIED